VLGIRVDDELFLRLHEERHAEELFRVTDQNRAHLRHWMPWVDGTSSPADTREYLRGVLHGLAEGRQYGFAILDRGQVVGSTDLRITPEAKEAEIGYWLAAAAQGRGIITRTTRALVQFALEQLQMNRVVILCAVDNERSCAVPKRLGFTLEGTFRLRELVPGREQRDQLVYALLRSEWEATAW
jgi:ribosomal-protein-serine acetyltransferase